MILLHQWWSILCQVSFVVCVTGDIISSRLIIVISFTKLYIYLFHVVIIAKQQVNVKLPSIIIVTRAIDMKCTYVTIPDTCWSPFHVASYDHIVINSQSDHYLEILKHLFQKIFIITCIVKCFCVKNWVLHIKLFLEERFILRWLDISSGFVNRCSNHNDRELFTGYNSCFDWLDSQNFITKDFPQ